MAARLVRCFSCKKLFRRSKTIAAEYERVETVILDKETGASAPLNVKRKGRICDSCYENHKSSTKS